MQGSGEDFGEQDEDTEIQNFPLYAERKADGIYRYRRRVPKNFVERVGKGYLYRNIGRTKKVCCIFTMQLVSLFLGCPDCQKKPLFA